MPAQLCPTRPQAVAPSCPSRKTQSKTSHRSPQAPRHALPSSCRLTRDLRAAHHECRSSLVRRQQHQSFFQTLRSCRNQRPGIAPQLWALQQPSKTRCRQSRKRAPRQAPRPRLRNPCRFLRRRSLFKSRKSAALPLLRAMMMARSPVPMPRLQKWPRTTCTRARPSASPPCSSPTIRSPIRRCR